MLHTERATRGSLRAFVRYDDLLADWTIPMFRVGHDFGLRAVTEASANSMRKVHQFVDPDLHRTHHTWADLAVPKRLQEIAEESWQALSGLADEGDAGDRRTGTRPSTSCATPTSSSTTRPRASRPRARTPPAARGSRPPADDEPEPKGLKRLLWVR